MHNSKKNPRELEEDQRRRETADTPRTRRRPEKDLPFFALQTSPIIFSGAGIPQFRRRLRCCCRLGLLLLELGFDVEVGESGHFSDSRWASRERFMSFGGKEPSRGSGSYFMRSGRRGRRMVGSRKTYSRGLLSFGGRRTSRSCSRPTRRTRPPRSVDLYTQADPPPTPPPDIGWRPTIGEEETRGRTVGDHRCGSRKKGRIYGKGVVPAYSYPRLIGDVDDDDTATGPPDVR
ncbi:hypothetical protein PIB30_059873 [Stylosanthes scabra]|uniref:Uncharacterized protein n=1 Tax=Stylosanthes scabra TaxID=79078 RepID=A0ABU6TK44_9FABA|nr:hypothetical protein [Stylosanthes scabra]